ncbi:SAM-dependent methyltransferase [Allocatelliglobosispora scoriae]|uniref:SAM-dependent methyltransferase n=1 Tax=Allocatelliglobosispora scoriae TaxID=643052 RepID=A0A841BXL1_9ACTN|nr:class I SAM-dependent methyltransferase [Allocatelliglobosispora scoriae]MBB5873887.1 SAM-dependent methyltransferase [Allocatelliglobosispora scoriae]
MTDPTAAGYDAVAARYAAEIGDELPGKPVDRAFLTILAESAGLGVVADVGCGPGHITSYLHRLGVDAVGVDLSPGMVAVARQRHPSIEFTVGSLLSLPVADGGWAGAVCAYSIIHLAEEQRPVAFAELARALAPGGWLLLSFHVSDADHAAGEVQRLASWWGHDVALDFHYLDPDRVAAEVAAAGFEVKVSAVREPWPNEHASRRAHLLAQRRS